MPMRRMLSWTRLALVGLVALAIVACSGPERSNEGGAIVPAEATATSGISPATATAPPQETPEDVTATTSPDGRPTSVSERPTPQPSATTAPARATATAIPPETATAAPVTVFDPSRVSLSVEVAASGFTHPDFITHAGDGSGRIFVAEKIGRVRLLDGTPFLDISDRVLSPEVPSPDQEMGLIGVAFHPDFETNGYLYIHYINLDQDHVIARFTANGDAADPASEKVLLTHPQPETNFNGGMLEFGPDGYLYIGFGTGGQSMYLHEGAQDLGTWLSKILRIDVDGGDPYAIPPDNPFVSTPGALPEIWAYGLRNPFRFAFDPATGEMYIASPGQFQREWLNVQPAGSEGGENYGWPMFEGSDCWNLWPGECDPTGVEPVVYERATYGDGNCALIGGYVYRGTQFPLLQGAYLMGDYCSGRIWTLGRDEAGEWVSAEMLQIPGALIGSFGVDEAGEVYVADIMNGVVYRILAGPA